MGACSQAKAGEVGGWSHCRTVIGPAIVDPSNVKSSQARTTQVQYSVFCILYFVQSSSIRCARRPSGAAESLGVHFTEQPPGRAAGRAFGNGSSRESCAAERGGLFLGGGHRTNRLPGQPLGLLGFVLDFAPHVHFAHFPTPRITAPSFDAFASMLPRSS